MIEHCRRCREKNKRFPSEPVVLDDVPAHETGFKQDVCPEMVEKTAAASESQKHYHNVHFVHFKHLPELPINESVWLQDAKTKLWDKQGDVRRKSSNGRSYLIELTDGKMYWRNRRFLKKFYAPKIDQGVPTRAAYKDCSDESDGAKDSDTNPCYKRKLRKKPKKKAHFYL